MLISEILFKSFRTFNKQNKYLRYKRRWNISLFKFKLFLSNDNQSPPPQIYRNFSFKRSISKIVLIEITYSKPNIPSFPLDPHEPKKKNTSSRPTSTIYNLVQRLSGAIDASESATRTSGYILS